jgi:hypothetical protein
MEFLFSNLAISTAALQVATVVFLFLRPIRKYGFVLAYLLLQLGTSAVEMTINSKLGTGSKLYFKIFWTDEIVLDILLFFILILLTYRAMEGSPAQGHMRRALGAVMVMAMVLPFVLFKGAFVTNAWFDHTSQLLNFGGAILNLCLWTALLGPRKRDPQLLTVSAGFGVVVTGVAISFGLRRLVHHPGAGAHSLAWSAANLIFVLAHLAGAASLCWAFRPAGLLRHRTVVNLDYLSQKPTH